MKENIGFGYSQMFKAHRYWGMCTRVDLFNCDRVLMKNPTILEHWVKSLVKELDMDPIGEPLIEYTGNAPHLYGYSVVQLIQTSDIVAHFCDDLGDIYIDIFSCKEYDPQQIAYWCKDYFNAHDIQWDCSLRGYGRGE